MSTPTVLDTILWLIIPYLALAVFVLGHIWRFRRDRFGWTSRSSQIYESKLLRIGSPLFHYGIIFVFLGHVIGLGIPKTWTEAVGISDHVYHFMAISIGSARRRRPSAGSACSSTAGGRTPACSGRRRAWTSSCTSCSRSSSSPACTRRSSTPRWAATTTAKACPGGSASSGCSSRRHAHGAGPTGIPGPRHGRDPPLRDLALHPTRPRLRRAARVPDQALHRLPREGPGQAAGEARLGAHRLLSGLSTRLLVLRSGSATEIVGPPRRGWAILVGQPQHRRSEKEQPE